MIDREELMKRADEAFDRDDYETAASVYSSIIAFQPDDPRALQGRGAARHQMGLYEEALADYTLALKFDPENESLFFNIGLCHDLLGRAIEADAWFSRAIELNPEYALALYARANTRSELKRFHDAVRDYEDADRIGFDRHRNEHFLYWGKALEKIGEAKAALGRYREIIEHYEPEEGSVWTGLFGRAGISAFVIGDFDSAETYLLRAAEREPDNTLYLIHLAALYKVTGNRTACVRVLERIGGEEL
jgi:tetratricopeptide (TPR) repeat protein